MCNFNIDELLGHIAFQSTHPRGVRLVYTVLSDLLTVVSIHAPAWGATKAGLASVLCCSLCFNPRTRVGCDQQH